MAVLQELDTLAPIREKVEAGERLDFEDGLTLMETDDLLALGELADLARRERGGGDEVFFVQNINLYQTNVCRVKCKFCAFAKTRKQEDSYTISADELVEDAVQQYELAKFTEIHCVNGENPHVDLEFYDRYYKPGAYEDAPPIWLTLSCRFSNPPRAAKNGTCVVPACVTSGPSPETAALRMRSNWTSQPTSSTLTLIPVWAVKGWSVFSMSGTGCGPLFMIHSVTVPLGFFAAVLAPLSLLELSSPPQAATTRAVATKSAIAQAIASLLRMSPPC